MERTRRNIIKMSTLVASALATKAVMMATKASANPGNGGGWGQGVGGGRGHGSGCVVKGTLIETAQGPRAVEDLKTGDMIPAKFGGLRPIREVTRRRLASGGLRVRLVEMTRGALGPDTPSADLLITDRHMVLVDGWLFRVGTLVNDRTIKFAPNAADQDIYHIRLDSHDVIYAQGAPIDTLPLEGEAYCAPDVPYRGRIELWSRARSAVSPWIDIRTQADIARDRMEEYDLAA